MYNMDSNSILYQIRAKIQQPSKFSIFYFIVWKNGVSSDILISNMKLQTDYKNILLAFTDRDVKFMLVGEIAMAIQGKSDSAVNLDIWVMPDSKNAPLVIQSLKDFGAPADYLTTKDLQKEGIDFQIGLPPKRIRVLTSVEGLKFEKALAQSKKVDIEGISVQVLSV